MGEWGRLLHWVAHPLGFGFSKEPVVRMAEPGVFDFTFFLFVLPPPAPFIPPRCRSPHRFLHKPGAPGAGLAPGVLEFSSVT